MMRNVKHPERNERLRQYQKSLGITVTEFGARIGFTLNYTSQLVKGHTTITPNKAYQITQAFPDLSSEWLLEGVGTMIVPPVPQPSPEKMALEDLPGIIRNLQDVVENLEARLKTLENRL